jgi:hypothetical protein
LVNRWWIEDDNHTENLISTGSSPTVNLAYSSIIDSKSIFDDVTITIVFSDIYGKPIIGGSSYYSDDCLYNVPDKGVITCRLDHMMLMPGVYSLQFRIAVKGVESDYVEDAGTFEVVARDYFRTGKFPDRKHGYILADPIWGVKKSDTTESD